MSLSLSLSKVAGCSHLPWRVSLPSCSTDTGKLPSSLFLRTYYMLGTNMLLLPIPPKLGRWYHYYFWPTAKEAAAQWEKVMCLGHRASQGA